MTTRPWSSETTALEVVDGVDLTGRSAVVTGAASGIGIETARALASAGASVVLAVRDIRAGQTVAADIIGATGNDAVAVRHLDLADLTSVRGFVDDWRGPLDVLVNNAGIMNTPERRTPRGWELQLAVNHLGHFALATGLHAALAAAGTARVVSVSSSGHAASPLVLDDLFFERRAYDPALAYGQSKTANVLFALEATRRWATDGVVAKAVMPGGIWTNLQRHWDPSVLASMKATYPGKSPEQGAATSLVVATSPEITADGPVYYEDCGPAAVVPSVVDGLHGVVPHALDPDTARRLWEFSTELVTSA
ncbi:MAG: SDR family NAD(P)-dependent oxidoreductase [Nocardioides sp.]